MPLIGNDIVGRQGGPDGVARAKRSWQAVEREQRREAREERAAVAWLLENGCGPWEGVK